MPLKETLLAKILPARDRIAALVRRSGSSVVSQVTVRQIYGGLRGVRSAACETSELDPAVGIRYRGHSIQEVCARLPRAAGGAQPLPEGVFYLLLTGDMPDARNIDEVRQEWQRRSTVPEHVLRGLDALPTGMHPMTQLSIGVLLGQTESLFAERYQAGLNKQDLWDPMYEDCMTLLARLPRIAAHIYRRCYHQGTQLEPEPALDWAAGFARLMGVTRPDYQELMRLYLVLHCDHDGGSVSGHATHLVGSALSDCYYALSAGLNGLAGPLHGLASQSVYRWLLELRERFGGGVPSHADLERFCEQTLARGQVIPGYGHATLRTIDPRYTMQREFCQKHLSDDELFQIVSRLFEVVPEVLRKHGKAKNPWPNVDAHSGIIHRYYGVDQADFFPVLFGVSRALGVLASLVWDRALGLPLEWPDSVTMESIGKLAPPALFP
jgi:citrate synthase